MHGTYVLTFACAVLPTELDVKAQKRDNDDAAATTRGSQQGGPGRLLRSLHVHGYV